MQKIVILLLVLFSNKLILSLKIPWVKSKNSIWNWNKNEINYVEYTNNNKQAILLIHGFGSSLYHWRYNIPELSKYYDVYAFDLIGFGKSSKQDNNYNIELWTEQTNDFINNIIQKDTILIGNSLGGCITLNTSNNKYVNGIILLNSYINFDEEKKYPPKVLISIIKFLTPLYFNFMKNEKQIYTTLTQLYPENPEIIDNDLVNSIIEPTNNINSLKVLDSIIIGFMQNPGISDTILSNYNKPLFVIWGKKDKWLDKNSLNKLIKIYPNTLIKFISAGHCPQDEKSTIVNDLIKTFIDSEI